MSIGKTSAAAIRRIRLPWTGTISTAGGRPEDRSRRAASRVASGPSPDVARIAIAYAARLEVKPTASDLRSGGLKNLLKGSALDQSGAISSILKVMYPDNSDLEAYPNLCLEYMMNEGIRLLKRALDRGDLTNLENLMPEMVTSGE